MELETKHLDKKAKQAPVELARTLKLARASEELKLQNEKEQDEKEAAALLVSQISEKHEASRASKDLLIQNARTELAERREAVHQTRAANVLKLQNKRALDLAHEHDNRPPLKRPTPNYTTVGKSSSSSSVFSNRPGSSSLGSSSLFKVAATSSKARDSSNARSRGLWARGAMAKK